VVTQTDKDFINNMGLRVNQNGVKLDEEGDLGESLLNLQAKSLKQKAVAHALGLDTENRPRDTNSDLASTIVTTALNKMEKVQETLSDEKKQAQEAASQAYQESDNLKAQLFTNQFQQLTKLQEDTKLQMAELKKSNNPKTALESIQEMLTIMDYLEKRRPGAQSQEPSPRTQVVNVSDQIELLKAQQQHEIEMKKLDLAIQSQKQSFELQMLQLKEDSERRWAEYKDSQNFKKNGLAGFQDIATALTASVEKEMKGEKVAAQVDSQPGAENLAASVTAFPCQFCGKQVNVKPGEDLATCPTQGCGAQYEIKAK
jgi:hypothetical protein